MLQGTLIVRLTSRYRTIEPITTSACPAAPPPCPCGRRGAPGMLADFVILNQDILTVPDEKLLETHPLATFVGGTKVFAAENANF